MAQVKDLLLLPAGGEKVGMRGLSTRSELTESPLTPTLSPQARGEGEGAARLKCDRPGKIN
jgi:hypothetical protein